MSTTINTTDSGVKIVIQQDEWTRSVLRLTDDEAMELWSALSAHYLSKSDPEDNGTTVPIRPIVPTPEAARIKVAA